MYLAKQILLKKKQYTLRQTLRDKDGRLTFQNLVNLGNDPSLFIEYPGGNAFYIKESLVDQLEKLKVDVDPDLLETLFLPFLDTEIRRAVEFFHNRDIKKTPSGKGEEEVLQGELFSFDKRRLHYLKFGTMDQGPVESMPMALMKNLAGKCRDEIEQYFLRHEAILEATELKSYLFVAFDIQRFFSGILAKKMPQALDQERVDRYFIEEICELNKKIFPDPSVPGEPDLNPYLVRYLIYFFDHNYLNSTLLDEFAQAFMDRHRFFKPPPPKPRFKMKKASSIFGLTTDELGSLTRQKLTKLYRKLAQTRHPDKGGAPEEFVELNDAFKCLLKSIKRTKK